MRAIASQVRWRAVDAVTVKRSITRIGSTGRALAVGAAVLAASVPLGAPAGAEDPICGARVWMSSATAIAAFAPNPSDPHALGYVSGQSFGPEFVAMPSSSGPTMLELASDGGNQLYGAAVQLNTGFPPAWLFYAIDPATGVATGRFARFAPSGSAGDFPEAFGFIDGDFYVVSFVMGNIYRVDFTTSTLVDLGPLAGLPLDASPPVGVGDLTEVDGVPTLFSSTGAVYTVDIDTVSVTPSTGVTVDPAVNPTTAVAQDGDEVYMAGAGASIALGHSGLATLDDLGVLAGPSGISGIAALSDVCARVGGLVLSDDDFDGAADRPVADVALDLVDSSGAVVEQTTTDADGRYEFVHLGAGDFTIVEHQPADMVSLSDTDGGNDDRIAVTLPDTVGSDRNFAERPIWHPTLELATSVSLLDDLDGDGRITTGDRIRVRMSAQNGGDVTLHDVTIVDHLSGEQHTCALVPVGESCELVVEMTVEDPGMIEGTFTVTADDPDGVSMDPADGTYSAEVQAFVRTTTTSPSPSTSTPAGASSTSDASPPSFLAATGVFARVLMAAALVLLGAGISVLGLRRLRPA